MLIELARVDRERPGLSSSKHTFAYLRRPSLDRVVGSVETSDCRVQRLARASNVHGKFLSE
jgi:hypothetical protein